MRPPKRASRKMSLIRAFLGRGLGKGLISTHCAQVVDGAEAMLALQSNANAMVLSTPSNGRLASRRKRKRRLLRYQPVAEEPQEVLPLVLPPGRFAEYQPKQEDLIKRLIARLPSELGRERQRLLEEGMVESYVVAKQFLVSVRYAAKAALVRKNLARLVQGKGGCERFVPLDVEFRDPRGQLEYLPGKAVRYGPSEPLPQHRLLMSEVMAELPPQWRQVIEAPVHVYNFCLNVYSTNKHNRDSGPKVQTVHRNLPTCLRNKFSLLKPVLPASRSRPKCGPSCTSRWASPRAAFTRRTTRRATVIPCCITLIQTPALMFWSTEYLSCVFVWLGDPDHDWS